MKKFIENFRKSFAEEVSQGRIGEWKFLLEETSVELLSMLASLHKNNLKNFEAAEKLLLIANQIDPSNANLLQIICEFYHDMMDQDKALKYSEMALHSCQENDSIICASYAVILSENGEYKKSKKYFEKALKINANNYIAKFGLACEDIRSGNLKRGWKNYESRFDAFESTSKYKNKYSTAKYWDGKRFPKENLVIFNEQGVGDFIFALRFVPELLKKNINVIFDVDKKIQDLLAYTKFKNLSFYQDDLSVNYCCSIMSLPHLLNCVGYEEKNYENIFEITNKQIKGKPKVGICIAGNSSHPCDYRRSMSLSVLQKLFCDDRFVFHLIQKNDNLVRNRKTHCVNLIDCKFHGKTYLNAIESFQDTANLVDKMDAIVTVDTSVAHIAGALKKPTFVLLDKSCDFRWRGTQNSSPWYQTWRLFRQKEFFNWEEPVAECHKSLLEFFNI